MNIHPFVYFGNRLYNNPPNILCFDKELEEATKESLKNLVREYNIENNENDLFEILYCFSWEWGFTEFNMNHPNMDANMFKDCKLLLDILNPDIKKPINISRMEFGEQASQGYITDSNVFYILLKHLDISSLTETLKGYVNGEYFKNNQKPKRINGLKSGFIELYLLQLFEYLKNETNLKTESNNKIYKFIKEFCCVAGVDWETLSTQSDPAVYLKKTFHLLRGGK